MNDELPTDTYENFVRRFSKAFREAHEAVLTAATSGKDIPKHFDYPKVELRSNGLPYFSSFSLNTEQAPNYYAGLVQSRGLLGLFAPAYDKTFAEIESLTDYLNSAPLLKSRLSNGYTEDVSSWRVRALIFDCVDRYTSLYGLEAISSDKERKTLRPIVDCILFNRLDVALIVPIALTRFAADRFSLGPDNFVCRMGRTFQLSRARLGAHGSGAVEGVVEAATHAFVSVGWSLENTSEFDVNSSLRQVPEEATTLIEAFFAALRMATGIDTGYAQVIFAPRKWALNYYCDLPVLYGSGHRRYPSSFDRYGWVDPYIRMVSKAEAQEVSEAFQRIRVRTERKIEIAVKRLNSCLTRDDAIDAILDATIGLEVLLGDNENQALSYKLRLRAAALAGLIGKAKPEQVLEDIKAVYAVRSEIVHGQSKKSTKTVDATERYSKQRDLAALQLRLVLDALLYHPRYLSPELIDKELLLPNPTQAKHTC